MVRVGDFDRFAFIVGAPRCGTTTLAQFLKNHPSVSFPAVKEPHFFSQHDLRGLSRKLLEQRVEEAYLDRFFDGGRLQRTGVDASVTYLYLPEQLEPVLELWPDSRFVVAVRNPLEMLPSLHRRLIYLGDETIADFRDAWNAVPDRAAGLRIPSRCADPRWLRYDQAACFGTYLERLFAVVGRDRCHVVVFDDLVAEPAREYRKFMDFLGLAPMPRSDFAPRRPGKSVRIRWLQRLLKRPPLALRNHFAGEKYRRRVEAGDDAPPRQAPSGVMSLRKRLLEWNRIACPIEPLPADLQDQICRRFQDEVARLGQLIDRDLSHWLQPPGDMAELPGEGGGAIADAHRAA